MHESIMSNYVGTKEYRDRIARFFVGYLKERYFTYDKISAVKSVIHYSGPNFHQIFFTTFPWRVPGKRRGVNEFLMFSTFSWENINYQFYPTRLPVKHFMEVPRNAWSFSRKKTSSIFTRIILFEEVQLKMLLARNFVNLTDLGLSISKFSIFTFNHNIIVICQ